MLSVKLNGCFCVCKNKMEEFRELPEYPGYRIGNMGTIIGLYGKPLNQYLMSNGYYGVNVPRIQMVHKLVSLAWISNLQQKPTIDHINRIRTDNRICNLRWATWSENHTNKILRTDSKSGVTGLCFDNTRQRWTVSKTIDGVLYHRRFKERSDAEIYLQQIVGNL